MPQPTNADIMHQLGSMSAEATHAKESRRVIHEKMDEMARFQVETVRTMEQLHAAVEATTLVATQGRDVANAALQNIHRFEATFNQDQLPIITAAQAFKIEAEPVLATMRLVRNIVVSLLGLGILSVAGVGAAALWAREWLAMTLRYILGL